MSSGPKMELFIAVFVVNSRYFNKPQPQLSTASKEVVRATVRDDISRSLLHVNTQKY